MKLETLFCALALALSLVACDSSPAGTDAGSMMGTDAGPMMGTDAGPMMMGTDAGPMTGPDAGPPDMNAVMRQQSAIDRVNTAYCTCDMTPFATAAECASFNGNAAQDACEASAYSSTFAGNGAYFTCTAGAYETYATCIEAASCDDTAVGACEDAVDAATTTCEAFIDETAGMAFGTAYDMCVETNVIGPAGMCPDDSSAVSTTGMAVFMGTTTAAGNDLEPPAGCHAIDGGGGSPELAFRWTAPADGTYVFDTIGSGFDTVLYLRAGCAATDMEIGCNDDVSDTDYRSRLMATVTSGQEVLVVVEGFSDANAGDFVVNINAM
ncbi:MAG: hypothetical protein H6719_04665 [Sandaracinaceae bacterium]|nr:hypothetical protein [Sandaracinaceae bacterium]